MTDLDDVIDQFDFTQPDHDTDLDDDLYEDDVRYEEEF